MTGKVRMTAAEFREARRKLGLSAGELARLLGVDQVHVYRMEMEPGKPTSRQVTETIRRLVEAYLAGYRPPDWPASKR